MKLVVDTNILFSYFWKNSFTKSLIMSDKLELFAPDYALEEINKYKKEIIKKTGISEREFSLLRVDIAISVNFVPIQEYKNFLKKASEISPDKNDIDFFALALKLKLPIWSNDVLLNSQSEVKVYTTKEVVGLVR